MNPTTQTLIRSILKVGAGVLVAHGWADDSQAEAITGGIVALIAVLWGLKHRSPGAGKTAALLGLAGFSLSLAGCARFTTTQIDTSYAEGKPQRTITTRASASTICASSSALANFKASQTDKTQAATVGSLSQESHAQTNALDLVAQFLGAAIRAAAKTP